MCKERTAKLPVVASFATSADFFALAQFVATHHLAARKRSKKLFQSRGIPMAIVTRLASAVAAAIISGAVLSLAIY